MKEAKGKAGEKGVIEGGGQIEGTQARKPGQAEGFYFWPAEDVAPGRTLPLNI